MNSNNVEETRTSAGQAVGQWRAGELTGELQEEGQTQVLRLIIPPVQIPDRAQLKKRTEQTKVSNGQQHEGDATRVTSLID